MASVPASRTLPASSVSPSSPLQGSPSPASPPAPAPSTFAAGASGPAAAFAAMTHRPPPLTRQAAIALTGIVLMVSALFGSTTLSRLASLLLAAPIVFILCLVTLATSNIVFSILYSRRQQQKLEQMQHQSLSTHASKTAATSAARQPGQAHRHAFHSLRPAYFSRPVAWSAVERRRKQEQAAKYRTPIADTMPQLSEAIDTVIELVLRDYVAGWMRAITVETVVQQRIEELLRLVLLRLKQRVIGLDLTQLMVMDLVPKITSHVNDFRKAEMALRGNRLERKLTASDELDFLVANQFRRGKLHRAISASSTSASTVASEEAYLRGIVQAVLPTLLPPNEAHSLVLSTLLREILVGAVLRPVMEILSDPDYWNQNVDLYAGKAIREQNMVKKLREALKQHADSLDYDPRGLAASYGGEGANETRDLHPKGDLHSFEDFLKMIKRCDSLLDVKRIRNTIMIQIRKKKTLIAGRERDEIVNGSKVEDIIVYINKLDIAKRHAEKRIEALGGPAYSKRRTKEYTPSIRGASSAINLETVLTNPTGLSYFMEFQDRRNIMNELQFWLLIESLNIKAETHDMSDASIDSQSFQSKESTKKTTATMASMPPTPSTIASIKDGQSGGDQEASTANTAETSDTLREDVRMIYEMYFSEASPRRVRVDPVVVETVRAYGFAPSSMSPTSDPSSISTPTGSSMTSTITTNTTTTTTTTTAPPTITVSGTRNSSSSMAPSLSPVQEEPSASVVKQYLLQAQKQVYDLMLTRDYPEFAKSDLYYKFVTSYQALLAEGREGGGSQEGYDHDHSEPTTPIAQRPSLPPMPPVAPSMAPLTSAQQHQHPHPHRSSLLSALNLGSPERNRETRPTEHTTKRSSTGSFLEIFGLGREKDRDKDRDRDHRERSGGFLEEHGPAALRRALSLAPPAVAVAPTAAGTPSSSADYSLRAAAVGSGSGSGGSSSSLASLKSRGRGSSVGAKAPPPPAAAPSPAPRGLQPAAPIPSLPLSRSRSMGSLKSVDLSAGATAASTTTAMTTTTGQTGSGVPPQPPSLSDSGILSGDDPQDPSTGSGGGPAATAAASALGDSLLLELERQGAKLSVDGDDSKLSTAAANAAAGGSVTTPTTTAAGGSGGKAGGRKPSVFDAMEAVLSSILQTEDQHQKGGDSDKPGRSPQAIAAGPHPGRGGGGGGGDGGDGLGLASPAFATAPEDSELMRWGSTRSKRKKKALRIVTPEDEAAAAAAAAAVVAEAQGSANTKEPVPTENESGSSSKVAKADNRVIRIKPRGGDRPRSSLTASLELQQQQSQSLQEPGLEQSSQQQHGEEETPSSPVGRDGTGSQDSPKAAMSPGPYSATEAEGDSESDSDSEDMGPSHRRRRRREEGSGVQDNVHLAAPGDLLLSQRIQKLAQDIENVKKQEQIVETLIQMAERQGRQNELRILKKSKSALRREILGMEYQKTQYEVQEEENMIMPGRSTLSITSSTVGYDGSKEFALYVIEVHQMAQDGSFASGWVIARRYSEFFALHQVLKEKFPIVKQFELPGKRGFLKLQKSFVESRRIGLERYLRLLIRHADICQSQELRSFLSQENVALPQFSSSSSSSLLPTASSSMPSIGTAAAASSSSTLSSSTSSHALGPSLLAHDSGRHQEGSLLDPSARGVNHGRSLTQSQSSPFSFEQLFHSNPLSTASAHHPNKEHTPRGGGPATTAAAAGAGGDSVGHGGEIGTRGAVSLDLGRASRGDDEAESGFMKHIYQTVSEGLDDMFSGGPPTVLGNITKQLGNQMMQFSLESDDQPSRRARPNGAANRRSHDGGTNARVATTGSTSTTTAGAGGASGSAAAAAAAAASRPTMNSIGRQRSLTDSRVYPTRLEELTSAGPNHVLPMAKGASHGGVGGVMNGGVGGGGHPHAPASTMAATTAAATATSATTATTIVETMNAMGQPTLTVVGEEAEGVTTFTEPLCDLFIELFELKEKNNWLRRQAVVIILQQVLGGTIERKLRDMIKAYVDESMLTFYVLKLRDTLWPPAPTPVEEEGYEVIGKDGSSSTGMDPATNGAPQKAKPKAPRTAEQKAFTRDQANRKLSAFLPDLLGNMVGHQNARRGARRLFAAFQNRRLNQQLVYTALDEVVAALWPELVQSVDQCGIHLKQPSSTEARD